MTRDELLRLALDAGWSSLYSKWVTPSGDPDWNTSKESMAVTVTMKQIEAFTARVQEYERNRCIQACDGIDLAGADDCIEAIRAIESIQTRGME